MAHVVPSLARQAIERMFPTIIKDPKSRPGFDVDVVPALAAVVDIVEAIPDELLVLEPPRFAELTACIAAVRGAVDMLGSARLPRGHPLQLQGFEHHPIALIHDTLQICPDAAPAPDVAALPFIDDRPLAELLRVDITTAHSALGNCEWKAATVIAGSVIEALLLWSIVRHDQSEWEVAMQRAAKGGGTGASGRTDHPERWRLPDYIEVAAELGCITGSTRIEARQTKDYRNLIHPGAAQRRRQQCDLGTAHIAIGTMDHVIRDLTQRGIGGRCP